MKVVKDVHDFKLFLKSNREKLYANVVNASDISINDEWMQEDQWDDIYKEEEKNMATYNIGEVWWTQFPFEDSDEDKHRPAIVIDEDTIAVLVMMVTSKEKPNPFCIKIDDWEEAGLTKASWARIDRIISLDEWRMDRKIGDLSRRDLTKFMQLISEFITGKVHEFSLVAIKNPKGKMLQVYDERWKCWLFPYFRSIDPKKENIDKNVSCLLGKQVITKYETVAKHCKYSASDDQYKIYQHILYSLALEEIPENLLGDTFEIAGVKYAWKSFAELENDKDAMEKNDDIIAFVKTRIS